MTGTTDATDAAIWTVYWQSAHTGCWLRYKRGLVERDARGLVAHLRALGMAATCAVSIELRDGRDGPGAPTSHSMPGGSGATR